MIAAAIGTKTEDEVGEFDDCVHRHLLSLLSLQVKMHARRYLAKLEHERRAPDDTPSDAKYVLISNFLTFDAWHTNVS